MSKTQIKPKKIKFYMRVVTRDKVCKREKRVNREKEIV